MYEVRQFHILKKKWPYFNTLKLHNWTLYPESTNLLIVDGIFVGLPSGWRDVRGNKSHLEAG
jgi:hypothetical protein